MGSWMIILVNQWSSDARPGTPWWSRPGFYGFINPAGFCPSTLENMAKNAKVVVFSYSKMQSCEAASVVEGDMQNTCIFLGKLTFFESKFATQQNMRIFTRKKMAPPRPCT